MSTIQYIIGIDEVGRGSAIGEITICAVRAPIDWKMDGLADSKKLSAKNREIMSQKLLKCNEISHTISSSSNQEIDKIGLGICLKKCYVNVINNLYQHNDQVILDGNLSPHHLQEHGLQTDIKQIESKIKADTYIPAVMAASIIAKVYRDDIVTNQYHIQYPAYEWNKNMGYLTKNHIECIRKYGLSSLHRKKL